VGIAGTGQAERCADIARRGDGVLRVARYTLFEGVLPRESDEAHGDTA
jgi:hypothetical protein